MIMRMMVVLVVVLFAAERWVGATKTKEPS